MKTIIADVRVGFFIAIFILNSTDFTSLLAQSPESKSPPNTTKILFGSMGGPFWKKADWFTELAAKDLGYQFRKIYFIDDIASSYMGRLEKQLTEYKPEIFFYRPMPILNEQLYTLFRSLKAKGIETPKLVFFNGFYETNIKYDLRKLPEFMGEILPDEEKWARRLAADGIRIAEERFKNTSKGANEADSIGTIIIGGESKEFVSRVRTNAMSSVVKGHPNAKLLKVIDNGWNLEAMKKSAPFIYRQFPSTKLIISALAEFEKDLLELYKSPGKELPVHLSHDWTDENINMLKNGTLDAILGGHFVETACLLLDDWLHRVHKTPYVLIDQSTKSDMSMLGTKDAYSIEQWLRQGSKTKWRFRDMANHLHRSNKKLRCQFNEMVSVMKEVEEQKAEIPTPAH